MDSGGKDARMSSVMQGSRHAMTFLRGTPSLLASMLCIPMNTSAAVIMACPAPGTGVWGGLGLGLGWVVEEGKVGLKG